MADPLGCGSKFRTDSPLTHWKPMIAEWQFLVSRYVERIPEDTPYHHGELANVAILFAAAYRADWVALSEFGHRKRRRGYGRADLWLKSSKHEEFVEAKFANLWGDAQKALESKGVRSAIDRAKNDAREIRKDANTSGKVSIVFFCPRIPTKDSGGISELCRQYVNEVVRYRNEVKSSRFDLVAWAFPRGAERQVPDGKYRYPGVILAARREWPARRRRSLSTPAVARSRTRLSV